jgi:hypothetical protein
VNTGQDRPATHRNHREQSTPPFEETKTKKPSAILPGTVEQIIKFPFPNEPDEAQIAVEGADRLYRQIRIDNALMNKNGEEVSLKPGAQAEVTAKR